VRYYYLQDALYSVVGLTETDGDLAEAYAYDPYGRHSLITDGDSDGRVEFDATDTRTPLGASASGNPYTFTGRRHDSATGLHYYRYRYYDATRGRFISRDPVRNRDSHGTYRAMGNDPIKHVDPYGTYFAPIRPVGPKTCPLGQKRCLERMFPVWGATVAVYACYEMTDEEAQTQKEAAAFEECARENEKRASADNGAWWPTGCRVYADRMCGGSGGLIQQCLAMKGVVLKSCEIRQHKGPFHGRCLLECGGKERCQTDKGGLLPARTTGPCGSSSAWDCSGHLGAPCD
jgi:RHS repeat-associated protein